MSERDELFEIVMRDPISSGGDAVWTNDLISAFEERIKREHAHELAEKIRQTSAPMACFRSEDMQARADHGRRMADLIDPEIE